MVIINTLMFYVLFCSSVLVYGIGMLPVAEASLSRRNQLLNILESFSCVSATVALTFLIKRLLLVPLSLSILYPLVALLLFVSLSVFFEVIVQVSVKKTGSEFCLPYLAILLALSEGGGMLDSVMIGVATLCSYYILIPVLLAFNNRIAMQKNSDAFRQKICVFLCMVVLIFALYSLNISWFNVFVIK